MSYFNRSLQIFRILRVSKFIKRMSFKTQNNIFPPRTDASPKSSMKTIKVLDTPIKSDSDVKEYRVIQLANGLTACLIADKTPVNYRSESENETSDSEVSSCEEAEESFDESESGSDKDSRPTSTEQKMAAAALCVGVGSFSDPKNVPGMAHFLEHMVFMGSEKFPAENDFDSFIKKGGGQDNAATDNETTCFYFECLEKHLHEALDKFAQFFISPLMKKTAMTREREAIESEFQMALPSDSTRKEQLLWSLAKADSPVNSFAWGNLITLRDNISDDELYEGVHKFRKRHYSAHRMTLAIQARMPLDTLQSYVVECFSAVWNNGLPPEDFSRFLGNVFDTPGFNRIYYVKPTKDLCKLDLSWPLPPLRSKYKSKPGMYVSHLMGDEGKGSLLAYLRKKVWVLANEIGTGDSGSEENSIFTLYTASLVLTEEGLAHLHEVIEAVFSYINLLKKIGPQERVFKEIQSIMKTSFKFTTEETASDYVEELCEDMQFYPPIDYISGSELLWEYDPEGITEVLNHLTPENMTITVFSSTLPEEIKFDKVEEWFKTEYTDREISKEYLEKWSKVEPYPELQIPQPNPYLTDNFSILPELENNPEYPEKVVSTPLLEMWYRKDDKFKLPMAYYYFYLISPKSLESATSHSMCDMFVNLLSVIIAEELYPATMADLICSISFFEKGIILKVYGYDQKLPLLIDLVAKYLKEFNEHLTEEMFNAFKDKVLKFYYNRLLKPSALAKEARLKLLIPNHHTSADKYNGLKQVSFEDLKKFSTEFMSSLYVKVLVQGNVSVDLASEIVKKFVENLNYSQLPDNSYPAFQVAQLPVGEKCCRIMALNENDSNSIIANYYQSTPFSMKDTVVIEIIMMLIEEPLFDILRTKEQLGYNVYCSLRDTYGILGYTVTVNAQATKHSTQYVDSRIEEFLLHTRKLLAEIPKDELDQTKEDLIKTKQCVDVHLKEEMERNWSEIVSDYYIFDRLKLEIKAIEDVSLEYIQKWWDRHNLFGEEKSFKKLSVQIVGHDTRNKERVSPEKELLLKDVEINVLSRVNSEEGENKAEDYFIKNVQSLNDNLYTHPTQKMYN